MSVSMQKMVLGLKIIVLLVIVVIGLIIVYQGHLLSIHEPSKEKTILFQKTMKPSIGPYTGILKINMTPTKAFVVGDIITTQIEVDVFGVNWEENETCMVQMVFPDAICYIDSWSNITHQDWAFIWWEYETHDAVYAIYQKKVTLWYIHEGFYGVNITIWRPDFMETHEYSFPDLVQIKSYDYIEEMKRTRLAEALNKEVLGLTIVAVGPVFIQIIDLVQKIASQKEEE